MGLMLNATVDALTRTPEEIHADFMFDGVQVWGGVAAAVLVAAVCRISAYVMLRAITRDDK